MKAPNSNISILQTKQHYTSASSVSEVLAVKDITEQKIDIGNLQNLLLQRKIISSINDVIGKRVYIPQQNFIQRKCAHCEEEEKAQRKPLASFIQKKSETNNYVAGDTVSNQIQSRKGGGNSMPESRKSFMESRFGSNFSNVNIHTDHNAAQMSKELNAQAFTVGNNIYFNEGKYKPQSFDGKKLLAHELTHVVQQTGKIQRQTSTGGSSYTTMTRQQFEQTMQNAYGFTTIRDGSMADQVRSIGLSPQLTLPSWNSWGPGQASIIYQYIIGAYAEFSRAFGGFPAAATLYFFDVAYDSTTLTTNHDLVAEFGNNELLIYRAITAPTKGLPIGRSIASGRYRNSPPNPIPYGGSKRAAPIARPTLEQSVKRFIFHELGHGINNAGMQGSPALYPNLLQDYIKAVGRYPLTTGDELYDIGVRAVQTAIAQNIVPPVQYKITGANWNDPNWIEQPVSEYMVDSQTGPAGDDFAEAVMTFVSNPALLRSRSPKRYNFLNTKRQLWQPGLSPPSSASSPAAPAAPATGTGATIAKYY